MSGRLWLLLVVGITVAAPCFVRAQTEYSLFDTTATDTFEFWMQTPANYDPVHPPAILVWWHQFGAAVTEMRDWTRFDSLCGLRGWITASFFGPFEGKHYQSQRGLEHAQAMLDWAMQNAPFSRDSIYMAGGSMGGAGGLVWHNHHCGIHDYMPAAVVGGSPILDCELRQRQYVDSGHVLVAMQTIFGGFPWDDDTIAYKYHRSSAVHFADTLESMHFNALHLPVLNTWGTSDSAWNAEWFAYGRPAQHLDTLRRADHADTTVTLCSGIPSHGLGVVPQDSVLSWMSHFSVNRYPADISINADENKEYYWTRVQLGPRPYTMARYGVKRDFDHRSLDITVVRNVRMLDIECLFPWPRWDSLSGVWVNLDSISVQDVTVKLTHVPPVTSVTLNGVPTAFAYGPDTLTIPLLHGGRYSILFVPTAAGSHESLPPRTLRLVSAYPNPFNSQIALEIESATAAKQELRLYDITGRLAKTVTTSLTPGMQRVVISGAGLASGIYFAVLPKTGQAPLKLVLLK